ncbi:hypothetical protein [Lacinutrix jangbogonensis]|uniref:hypothetical protein n=1 Tax=Lacinutrix jangbogonensis TaxID=1469557 RepID=UPI00053CF4EB|nr:hypothetical protein [Lacinutrix jangbogonensis]
MKNSLIILLIVAFAFIGCDGRDRGQSSNNEIFSGQNLKQSFSDKIIHIPENYTEAERDTILNNGFKITIKAYTDMDNYVLKTEKKSAITHKSYYRDAKISLRVLLKDEVVFSEIIDKNFIIAHNPNFKNYLNNTILRDINYVEIYDDNILKMNIDYYNPLKKEYNRLHLIINKDKTYSINRNTI